MQSYIITASDAGQFFAAPMQCVTGWLSVFSPKKKPGQGHQRLEKTRHQLWRPGQVLLFLSQGNFLWHWCNTSQVNYRCFPPKETRAGALTPPKWASTLEPRTIFMFFFDLCAAQVDCDCFCIFSSRHIAGHCSSQCFTSQGDCWCYFTQKKKPGQGHWLWLFYIFSKPAHAKLCTAQYHSSSCNTSKVNHSPLKKPGQRHWLSTLKPRTIYIFLFYLSAAPVDCDCFDFFFKTYCRASQQPMQCLTGWFVVFFTPKESGTGASTSRKKSRH